MSSIFPVFKAISCIPEVRTFVSDGCFQYKGF